MIPHIIQIILERCAFTLVCDHTLKEVNHWIMFLECNLGEIVLESFYIQADSRGVLALLVNRSPVILTIWLFRNNDIICVLKQNKHVGNNCFC